MNFTPRDLRRGRRVMEESLTTASRIRRQFAAGRPPKPERWLDSRSALRSVAARLDALLGAMLAEGLRQKDLSADLVTAELAPGPDAITATDISAIVEVVPMVRYGKSLLTDAAKRVLSKPNCVVVGSVFDILDRDTTEYTRRQWATALRSDEASLQVMKKALESKKQKMFDA